MAIVVLGGTKSGKSRMVERVIIPRFKKAIVFDVVNCFKTLPVRISMDPKFNLENFALDKAYEIASKTPESFKIGLVPGEDSDYKKAFDKVITTAFFMGKAFSSPEDLLLVVCDEAGITSKFQSANLMKLSSRGRHWNCEGLFIAQRAQMIHGDIKGNISEAHFFRMPTAMESDFITGLVGKEIAFRISKLPRFHYVTYLDTNEVFFTDENGKIYEKRGY